MNAWAWEVRACAHELLFCLVSTSYTYTSYTYLVRNSESRAGRLESAAGHSPGRKLILQADCKRATAPVRRFVSTSAWSWSSRNRRRLDIPTSGDGVAARAELAPVISGRALLAAPDGEGVALQLVHVVQRVALVVVVARLDVLAWRGFLELPFASDDLDALDPLPVLLEIDVLDEEERAVQPLVGDLAFLGFEELAQYRCELLGCHDDRAVAETVHGPMLGIGEDVRERRCCMAQARRALATVHDQRGDRDGRPPLGGQRLPCLSVSHDGDVVGDRVRHRLELRPRPWHEPHHPHEHGRHAEPLGHAVRDRLGSTIGGEEVVEATGEIRRRSPIVLLYHERRLEQRQPLDYHPVGRGLEGEGGTGGAAKEECRPAGFLYQGRDVFDFPLHRVR